MEDFDYRGTPSAEYQWGACELPADYDTGYTILWFPCRADAVTFAKAQGWAQYAIARAWGFE